MAQPSIYLATPSYDGKLQDLWVAGALQFAKAFSGRHRIDILRGSFLPRLRDVLCSRFLESGASHMLCVDADIGWTVEDVEALLAADKWFVGGCYAIKNDKCEVPAKLVPGQPTSGPDGPTRKPVRLAEYVPAGFLLLTRACVAALTDHYRGNRYESQYGATTGLWTPLKGNGEDVSFCLRWREMGGEVWLHTGVHLKHVGERVFEPDVGKLVGAEERTFTDWDRESLNRGIRNLDDRQIVSTVKPWSLLHDADVELPALFDAFRKTKATRFLEIGTFKGATAAAMKLAFPDAEIVTLDLPDTTKSGWNAQANDQCGIALRELGLADKVYQWRMSSHELADLSPVTDDGDRFDLIFIDGDHSEEGCYRDLVNCSKLLNEGGCLVVHDFSESREDHARHKWTKSVYKAVQRFSIEGGPRWRATRLPGWLVKLEPVS